MGKVKKHKTFSVIIVKIKFKNKQIFFVKKKKIGPDRKKRREGPHAPTAHSA